MSGLPVISLHQPWASLLFTRQPLPPADPHLDGNAIGALVMPMVKRFETRSRRCPEKYIGQRILIHAAKRPVDRGQIGDWLIDRNRRDGSWMRRSTLDASIRLPLGCIVGSCVITANLPITDNSEPIDRIVRAPDRPALTLYRMTSAPDAPRTSTFTDISDQLPYGDWTPGRFAWQIEQTAPVTERCPWCWGSGVEPPYIGPDAPRCCVCRPDLFVDYAPGRCEPIPATGRQGWWQWSPSGPTPDQHPPTDTPRDSET